MDENLNSNTKPSEEVSAFGERDASYVNEAVQRLRGSGDVVVIESPNHALRDHYVKQILSLSFLERPGLTVHRCKNSPPSSSFRLLPPPDHGCMILGMRAAHGKWQWPWPWPRP